MASTAINIFDHQHGGDLPPKPRAGAPPSSGPCALCSWRCVPGDGASEGLLWFGPKVRVEHLPGVAVGRRGRAQQLCPPGQEAGLMGDDLLHA